MGLQEFKEVEDRSAVMGIRVSITKNTIAKVARCSRYGMFQVNIKKKSEWTYAIVKTLYEGRQSDKTCDLKEEHMVLYKLILECFMPRDGGTDYRSRDHNLFLHFLIKNFKINLPAYMFHYLGSSIKEGITKKRKQVPYPRLLSEIFHQEELLKKLRDHGLVNDKELGICTGRVLNGSLLGNMGIIEKGQVITSESDVKESQVMSNLMTNFPPIYYAKTK